MNEKTTLATLVLQGREIRYEWTKKKVKNLNLRIRRDRSIAVSSPRSVTKKQIEAFLTERASFILRALDRRPEIPSEPAFCEGETLTLLGRTLTLHQVTGLRRAVITETEIAIPYTEDREKAKSYVKQCAEEELERLVRAMCEEVFPLFCNDTPFPEIRFRVMTRAFANCRPREHILTFSKRLIFYPPYFIRYIVMHEFTHFQFADHSPAFHAALRAKMPDEAKAKALQFTVQPYF